MSFLKTNHGSRRPGGPSQPPAVGTIGNVHGARAAWPAFSLSCRYCFHVLHIAVHCPMTIVTQTLSVCIFEYRLIVASINCFMKLIMMGGRTPGGRAWLGGNEFNNKNNNK